MSLVTRLQKIFKPSDPKGLLGLSLQQHSVHYCTIDEGFEVQCNAVAVNDGNYQYSLKQLHHEKLLKGQCHLVLSSKHNQLVQIDKPALPEEELNGALKWQVKDLVTIAPENMIVDYFDGPVMSGGQEKINVVCASKDHLTNCLELLNNNEVVVKSITIEEFAFAALMPISDDAKLLLCQQPNEEMLILIVKQGKLYFQRRLRGMAHIANKSEAEIDMGTIDTLSLEIQRSTDYFERQLKQPPIKAIDVLVPMENEAYLARRLSENANVAVNLFTMPEGFDNYRQHAASVGAARLNPTSEVS